MSLNLLSDEYCPHCDNHFLLVAKLPKQTSTVESVDARVDASVLKDYRVEEWQTRSMLHSDNFVDRLG